MQIFALGVTHRTLPLPERELLALSATEAGAFAARLGSLPGVLEFVVLNTCNRLEIYGVAEGRHAVTAVSEAFCEFRPAAAESFRRSRIDLRDVAAIRHLLDVAVGLDSQMIGETEIFGQVKRAYAAALERGHAGPVLNRIFQKTFQVAKKARAQAGITEGSISTANVAVDLARNVFGNLDKARVLLLGAGEIGAKSGRAFRSRGAGSLTVSSRCGERTAAVAAELGATPLAFAEFGPSLPGFDIIVCATSAPEPILLRDSIEAAVRARGGRPMILIDLSMPRNVDPAVTGLENVYLFNLDDLGRITDENRDSRRRELETCAAFLDERAAAIAGQVERDPARSVPSLQFA